MSIFGKITLILLIIFLPSCITVRHESPPAGERPPSRRIPNFSSRPQIPTATITRGWSPNEEKISRHIITFPSINEHEVVKAEYWAQKTGGKKKLIIVLPIMDSTPFVGAHYAHVMTSWGDNDDFNVLLLKDTKKILYLEEMQRAKTETKFMQAVEASANAINNYVIDVRRLITWAETREEIDSKNIGIVGGSIAASISVIAMASDPRIKAGVFDKGGGEFHNVFAISDEPGLKRTREITMNRFGWNAEMFEKKILSQLASVDPSTWAKMINPARVLFISAEDDRWFGKYSVESLWEALGRPERVEYSTGHKFAFLLSLTIFGGHYADYKIFNHFNNRLK
ncbi:MAG: hypothetical protein Q7R91_01960 [bacterium]|nr:hypothetical protein [bacterium]